MRSIPIVEHFQADLSPARQQQVNCLAEQIRKEMPELAIDKELLPFVPNHIDNGSALVLDDLSDIPLLNRFYDVTFMQDRARLRAGDGDYIASCAALVPGYEDYCIQYLGLGSPTWLRPERRNDPLQLASACWNDRKVRRVLVHALRSSELQYIHPHMGTLAVWELAALLHRSSRRPVQVIAPPPGVTQFANNKLHFAHVVERLFGERLTPPTEEACNLANATRVVRDLAESAETIVLKVPESAGGAGNVVLPAARVRGKPMEAICTTLMHLLEPLTWNGNGKLLVGAWESDVLSAPSAQLWIPPASQGPPVIEGLYEQIIKGAEGFFVGNRPAVLPTVVAQEIVDRCALVAYLFQRLGYVGRCSFDLVLIGKSLGSCRVEFIECNGRWGGTSTPMTLMNRLVGDFSQQPYAVQDLQIEGLRRISFSELVDRLSADLFNVQTKRGNLVFFNVGRMATHSAITVLAIADSWEEASKVIHEDFPARVREMSV